MIALGTTLLALALADLLPGLARSGRALAIRGLASGTLALALGIAGGLRGGPMLIVVVYAASAAIAWSTAMKATTSETWAPWALAGLTALLIGAFTVVALVQPSKKDFIAAWLGRLPYGGTSPYGSGEFLYLAGACAFLTTPANRLVRLALRCVGAFDKSEQRLRGGRLIGPIERSLIFLLVVSGEPTAAALVVGAKSLLRFPEMSATHGAESRDSATRVDIDTEYLLVGSLLSWSIALVFAPFAA